MSPEEVRRAAERLRSVGGVYEYVAACIEHDNRPEHGALTDTQFDALTRPGAVRVVPIEGATTMTTTPETPALPGDLTDETIERAARAIFEVHDLFDYREWADLDSQEKELYLRRARAALAAARVAPVTPSHEERIEAATWALINGDTDVTDRGVSDSHYRERRAEVEKIAPILAPDTPSEPEWEHGTAEGEVLLARIMDSLAYLHCKSINPKADSPHMGYYAMSEDQREFLREHQRRTAEAVIRAWTVATTPAPSPDRENLIAELREEARIVRQMTERDPDGPGFICRWDPDEELLDRAADALAVPPVVNEAKLENEIRRLMLAWSVDGMPFPGDSRPAFIARGLVERQREWLGGAA